MRLRNATPNVCSAFASRKFQREAGLVLVHQEGPRQSTTTTFHYESSGAVSSPAARLETESTPRASGPEPRLARPAPDRGSKWWAADLCLVSCVSVKQHAPVPAKDLYISPWFRKARACVEALGCPWYILSAKYGLVDPNETIEPYEKTLKTMRAGERWEWARGVVKDLDPHLAGTTSVAIYLRQRADGFIVETFHDLCERMARRAGLPFDAPEGHHPRHRPFWEEETPMLLLRALERLPNERYDAIVVDEGQDFLPDWWPCLEDVLAQGREGTLYAFYDAHQNIFGGHLPPEALEVIEHRLVYNCRNTTRIAEYAARLLALEPRVRVGAPQGEEVEEIACRNADEMALNVAGRLTHLVDAEGIKPARIAILSTRTLRNSPFADDHRAGRFELVSLDAGRGSRDQVVFETLYRYKGLEADVVILLDLPGGSKAVEPRDLYVAATRAKHLLVVMRPA